jgi:hypothetical protein
VASGFLFACPPSSRLPLIDRLWNITPRRLAGHNYATALARRLIIWNIQKLDNSPTSRSWPSENSHRSSITIRGQSSLHKRPRLGSFSQPSNHKAHSGRERDAHQGSAAHPGFAPKKRHVHVARSPSHCVTHLASMRAGDCRGAVTRHRLLLNRIAACGLG